MAEIRPRPLASSGAHTRVRDLMSEAVDYFANHRHKLRFPWSLYHAPIIEGLKRAVDFAPGRKILNVGSGPFLEFQAVYRPDREFTICDVDERAILMAQEQHGARLSGADVLAPDAPWPYRDGEFDLVVTMDVIEHLPEPTPWLRELIRVLRPGGQLYLTTPNYGSLSPLPLIEATALELVARRQGFSRRHLHPTRFTKASLENALRQVGFNDFRVEHVALTCVLVAHAQRDLPSLAPSQPQR